MDIKEKLISMIQEAVGGCARNWADVIADHLLANGVTVQSNELLTNCNQLWIPASVPPTEYRDEYGELIPFLVCLDGTEYPFRAMYDGKVWGDGLGAIPVTHWMPLPEPPKGE